MKFIVMITLFIFINIQSDAQELKMRENFNSEMTGMIGTLSYSNLYLVYLSQDLIYKSFENKVHKQEELKVLIFSLDEIGRQIDLNLKSLYQMSESDKDAELILKTISVFNNLNDLNKALIFYIENKNDDSKEIYLGLKKKTWDNLKEVSQKSTK